MPPVSGTCCAESRDIGRNGRDGGPSTLVGIPLYVLGPLTYILYMGEEMTVSEARAELGPVTARAEHAGQTTYLTKHGHRAAAVVPAGTAELIERVEDLLDARSVQKALGELDSGEQESIPFRRRTTRSR